MMQTFTVDEYVELNVFKNELMGLAFDALTAIEAREIGEVTFMDCTGGVLVNMVSFGQSER